MFETLKHKKSQAKQSRSDVQSPNTNNLKPRTYNLTTFMFLKKQTLKFCFCLQKYAEDQRWWCLKKAIWFVFFSKLKMWNLKTRDRTVVEVWTSWIWFHFWTTTPIISHGVPTSEFACCLKKWEWKMLSFPRKHNFQFISGKELLYLMKEFWNGTSFRGHSSPWASSCQAPVICTHQNTMVSLLCTVVVFSKDSTAIPNVTIIGQKVLVHLSSGITG